MLCNYLVAFLQPSDAASLQCSCSALRTRLDDHATWRSLTLRAWRRFEPNDLNRPDMKTLHTERLSAASAVRAEALRLCFPLQRMPSCRRIINLYPRQHALEQLEDSSSLHPDASLGERSRAFFALERLSEHDASESFRLLNQPTNYSDSASFYADAAGTRVGIEPEVAPPEDCAIHLSELISTRNRECGPIVKASLDTLAAELSRRLSLAGVGELNSSDSRWYTGERLHKALQILINFFSTTSTFHDDLLSSPCSCKGADGLGFKGNDSNYYSSANNDICSVLRQRSGIPITLVIVFIAIGRRCGLLLWPVGFPGHFLCGAGTPYSADERFVDVYSGGSVAHRNEVLASLESLSTQIADARIRPLGTRPLCFRLINNVLGVWQNVETDHQKLFAGISAAISVYESEPHTDERISRVRLAVDNSDYEHAFSELSLMDGETQSRIQALYREEVERERKVLKRSDCNSTPLYKVGTVFYHARLFYRGVITGWEEECSQSQAWKDQMGVSKLPNGEKQPFYHSLVSSEFRTGMSSHTYVAQVRKFQSFPCMIYHSPQTEIKRFRLNPAGQH